jgi:hypothetical protein
MVFSSLALFNYELIMKTIHKMPSKYTILKLLNFKMYLTFFIQQHKSISLSFSFWGAILRYELKAWVTSPVLSALVYFSDSVSYLWTGIDLKPHALTYASQLVSCTTMPSSSVEMWTFKIFASVGFKLRSSWSLPPK